MLASHFESKVGGSKVGHRTSRVAVAIAAVALASGHANAAIFTWDGGGADANLGTGANWAADVAPPAASSGNTFVFGGAANLNPTAEVPYTVGKVQFNATGFDLGGAAINLVSNGTNTAQSTSATTGIYANFGSGAAATISAPLTTSALTMYADVATAGATINLNGPVTGGGVTGKLGLGRLVLRAANDFAGGAFEVRNGILGIGAAGAGGLAGQTLGPTTGNTTVIYADGGTRTVASHFRFGDAGGGAGTAATPRLTQFGLNTAAGGDGVAFAPVTQGDLIFAGNFTAVPTAAFHRFDVRSGTATTFNGNFNGGTAAFNLSKVGVGTLRLNGDNAALPTLDVVAGTVVAGTDTALGQTIFSGSVNGGAGGVAAPTGATRNLTAALVLSAPSTTVAKPLSLGATGFTGTLNFAGPITLVGLSADPAAAANRKPISVATGVTANLNSPVAQSGGSYGLQKAGLGNLVLNAANTYTGQTLVLEGPITANAANASAFNVGGGSLQGTGSVGGLRLYDENVLVGTNAIAAGVLSPGTDATAGTLSSTTAEFGAAAGYRFTIDAPGVTDLLALSGTLAITATPGSGNQFNIVVNGAGVGFDSGAHQTFVLATTGGITGFDANAFSVDASGFAPAAGGAFSVARRGDDLVLNYAVVPEPTTLAALGILGAALVRRRGD